MEISQLCRGAGSSAQQIWISKSTYPFLQLSQTGATWTQARNNSCLYHSQWDFHSSFFLVFFCDIWNEQISYLQGNQVHIWEWYMNWTHCPEAQAWRNFKCAEMEYAKTGIGGGLTPQAAKHHTAPHSHHSTPATGRKINSIQGNTRTEEHGDIANCEKGSAFSDWGGRGACKMMGFGTTVLLPPFAQV